MKESLFSTVSPSTVLWGQFVIYTIYCLAVICLIAWFASRISKKDSEGGRKVSPRLFYTWVGALVVVGVSLHVTTYSTIPWVKDDLFGSDADVVATYELSIGKTTAADGTVGKAEWRAGWPFESGKALAPHGTAGAPDLLANVPCGELVKFSVRSADNTYGFGIFRPDGSMEAQMQVVPQSPNELRWTFVDDGLYSIRSTEYAGPLGADVAVATVINVTGCGK
ncbi:MAG: hypothetical protein FWD11_01755 [Micrococcales bacterium]|nr:hypothetical protein [Micrococcales bacterium]